MNPPGTSMGQQVLYPPLSRHQIILSLIPTVSICLLSKSDQKECFAGKWWPQCFFFFFNSSLRGSTYTIDVNDLEGTGWHVGNSALDTNDNLILEPRNNGRCNDYSFPSYLKPADQWWEPLAESLLRIKLQTRKQENNNKPHDRGAGWRVWSLHSTCRTEPKFSSQHTYQVAHDGLSCQL